MFEKDRSIGSIMQRFAEIGASGIQPRVHCLKSLQAGKSRATLRELGDRFLFEGSAQGGVVVPWGRRNSAQPVSTRNIGILDKRRTNIFRPMGDNGVRGKQIADG